jgi:hypothetical protein
MAEFQTGESVPVVNGGTGLIAVGGAGQVLKVNAAGNALEFGAEGDFSITNIVAPTNADLTLTTSGTGNIILDAITIRGTTISSADSTTININEGLVVDGTTTVSGALTASTSLALATGATVTGILDEDAMGSDSATQLATQQSIKAYVDSTVTAQDLDFQGDSGGALNIDLDSETLDIAGGTGIDTSGSSNTLTVAIDSTVTTLTGSQTLTNKTLTSPVLNTGVSGTAVLDEDAMGTNSATQLATQQSIKAYADTKAVLTGTTNNTITTVTGAHAFQGEANLTFDGTDMLVASSGKIKFTDANESINSDGSNLILTSGGTAFKMPTSDGSSGQALVTDGSGTLSFDTVATIISDDTLATVRNNKSLTTAARTIDSINATFIDSAFYFLVQNDLVNEVISAEMFAVTNNDSASFLGNRRGIESGGGSNVPTLATDVSNGQFRVRATGSSSECKASFYKVAMSSSTTDATRGNTVTTSNIDVDSASESIDTFAHGTYRGAKYFISVDNDSKTEMDVVEALVVHDGTNAFVTSFGHTISGSNSLITVTAAISGSNVVVSAAGLETNLNVTIHKIILKDNMTAQSNANQKAFASVTVSSTATAVDLMDIDETNGAVYFIVGANSSEGAYSIQEVYTAATPGIPAVANGPFVSTKGTTQLEFTAAFDASSENSLELFASSTSGGSTTVSGYRISALAG